MPVYVYRHPRTGKLVEVIQRMTDVHEYSENGVQFERVFLTPRMSVDTQTDPFSRNDFLRNTNKKMTLGEMQDVSKEMSQKREEIAGEDPIKQKIFNDYQRKTGKRHPENKPKKIETKDFVMEFD